MSHVRLLVFGAATLYIVTVAVNIQVPLYEIYARNAGFGSGVTALAFGLYILGVLPVMFFLGGLSDRIGRKSTIIAGLLITAVATVIMIIFPTIYALCFTRLLQGFGFGLCIPATAAYLAEMTTGGSRYSAKVVAMMTSLGFGSGSLITSLALLSGSTLVPWSYWLTLVILLLCICLSFGLQEKKGEKSSFLRLPHYPVGSVRAGIAMATAWAASGTMLSIVPTELTKVHLFAWTGLMLFLLNAAGVASQPFARKLSSKTAMLWGSLLVPLGYSLLIAGMMYDVLFFILLGAAIAGSACYGFTYLGSLERVATAAGSQRARASSGYFFIAYIGFVIPSIVFGFLADKTSTLVSLQVFALLLIVFSVFLAISGEKTTT